MIILSLLALGLLSTLAIAEPSGQTMTHSSTHHVYHDWLSSSFGYHWYPTNYYNWYPVYHNYYPYYYYPYYYYPYSYYNYYWTW